MGSRVLLRADGGPRIGLGHVLRSLALSSGLRQLGFETICAVRAEGFELADLETTGGGAVVSLPAGASPVEDTIQTLQIAADNDIDWIVVDQCYLPISTSQDFSRYLTSLRGRCNTLFFAGAEGIDYDADCIVSPYHRTTYPVPPDGSTSQYLLGPNFFVFREEFGKIDTESRDTPAFARRILVTIGGSDEYGITSKVARALALHDKEGLRITFIIGPAYQPESAEEIRQAMLGREVNFSIVNECSNMAEELAKADVAVVGDGLTKYEGALAGTPCITLSRPNSDESLNADFAQVGSSVHLGDATVIDHERLGTEILSICGSRSRRLDMTSRGRNLVDGDGIMRIAEAIKKRPSSRTGA